MGVVSLLLWPRPPRPGDNGVLDGYVVNMFIDPVQQRKGIGAALLEACLDRAKELGIDSVFLHTTEAGRPLYEAHGFASNPDWLQRRTTR